LRMLRMPWMLWPLRMPLNKKKYCRRIYNAAAGAAASASIYKIHQP